MYINSCIPWVRNEKKFEELIGFVYKCGYQASIVEFKSIEEFYDYKKSKFYKVKPSNIQNNISIETILEYKTKNLPIPIIPRITLECDSVNRLKQELSKLVLKVPSIIVAIKLLKKEILEVAARDGRVNLISAPNSNYTKILSKGILSLARQNKCMIDLSITPIIKSNSSNRTRLLRVFYRLLKSAKPYSNSYTFGTDSSNEYNIRGPKETIALIHTLFKVPEKRAKEMLSQNPEKLAINYMKRDQGRLIEPGVEIVK
jgi:RNase P/RNase MRP subunit p30